MWKNILTILVITQLALPYVLGNLIKVNSPGIPPPPHPRPSCEFATCPSGKRCELQQVICCCPPCFPQTICIDDSIRGCRGFPCPVSQICVLQMASTTETICVDRVPDVDAP